MPSQSSPNPYSGKQHTHPGRPPRCMNRHAERQRCQVLYSGRGRGHSIRLTVLCIARPLACLLPPAPFCGRDAGADRPAIRHINRRTRPEVCLYLPSCRRTLPAPCIRSLLALTRLLCGLRTCGRVDCLPFTDWLPPPLLPSTPGRAHELQFEPSLFGARSLTLPARCGSFCLGCSLFPRERAGASTTTPTQTPRPPTYAHRPAAPACREPSLRQPCAPQHTPARAPIKGVVLSAPSAPSARSAALAPPWNVLSASRPYHVKW